MSGERPDDTVDRAPRDGAVDGAARDGAVADTGASTTDAPAAALTLASAFWQRTLQSARLMVGVPDYDAYVAHLREKHPEVRPLTREDFVRAAQDRRYGRGGSRCC